MLGSPDAYGRGGGRLRGGVQAAAAGSVRRHQRLQKLLRNHLLNRLNFLIYERERERDPECVG